MKGFSIDGVTQFHVVDSFIYVDETINYRLLSETLAC